MFKILIIAALGGLLFGFDTGIISGAMLFIQQDFSLSNLMTEFLVSSTLIGAVLGSLCSARLVNVCGRRKSLEMNAILFICSTFCSACAPSLTWLICGRSLVGFAIGIACYIVPLYIAELAPALYRGRLVAVNTITVTGGMLISYLVAFGLSPFAAWRWMLGLGALPAIVLWTCARFLPESPRWLIKKGRFEEARQILLKIRQNSRVAEAEFEEIRESLSKPSSAWKALLHPKMLWLLIVGIVLAMIQQLTGINTILYYAPILFKNLGFTTHAELMGLTVSVGLVNFLFTLFVMLKVDQLGRRVLLMRGLAGMTVCLILLCIFAHLRFENAVALFGAVVSLLLFIAFYAASVGCIFWIVIAEIYPLNVRGLAMGIASGANWGSNLLITSTFLSLMETIGISSTFLCYAVMGFLGTWFCYRYLPETSQSSLEVLETQVYG